MSIFTDDWVLVNDRGLDLVGNTDRPGGGAIGCVVFVHGWKGYKDYGFVPVLGRELAARGVMVHRFNLSCSGMTDDIETFARPELFALDTWNRQVEDVRRVVEGVGRGEIAGRGLPLFLCGHSRGGATVVLTAGRDPSLELSGVMTINAVDACCRMDDAARSRLLSDGFITTMSARTGQELRIGKAWLQEQIDDPGSHDVLGLCERIACPVLVMHGDADEAVDPSAGKAIAGAVGAESHIVLGANHVLNVANPAPGVGGISPQLGEVVRLIESFVNTNRFRTPI